MGSKTFDGVWFQAFPNDHLPVHVHGRYAGVTVIVEFVDGQAFLSRRRKAVQPVGAKVSDVAYVLRIAAKHAEALQELWRVARG